MSTGLECVVEEREPGCWFYVLERGDAPKHAWDWRDHADSFGPFASDDAAIAHLRRHHPNPGTIQVAPYEPTGSAPA